jgi:hypothetical protein|eukprot:6166571-Prymnesium_polylepis.1
MSHLSARRRTQEIKTIDEAEILLENIAKDQEQYDAQVTARENTQGDEEDADEVPVEGMPGKLKEWAERKAAYRKLVIDGNVDELMKVLERQQAKVEKAKNKNKAKCARHASVHLHARARVRTHPHVPAHCSGSTSNTRWPRSAGRCGPSTWPRWWQL